MQYIINRDNEKEVYELVYDRNQLEALLKEIVKNCSVRHELTSIVYAKEMNSACEEASKMKDSFGNKIHENIRDMKHIPDPELDEPGLDRIYEFTSDKLCTPSLVSFINSLLEGTDFDYDKFLRREELYRKSEAITKISILNMLYNKIEITNIKEARLKLNQLLDAYDELAKIPNYDINLLSLYYDKVQDCIGKELVEKTTYYGRKLTPSKKEGK